MIVMSAPARRCSTCGTDWPTTWKDGGAKYALCPKCEGKTDVISNADPLDEETAHDLKIHLDFERFYQTWELERGLDAWMVEEAA